MYTNKIIAESASEAFCAILGDLKRYGEKSAPRGFEIVEIENANIIITNPRNRIITCPERKFNAAYAFGELAWYLSGSNDVDQISYYSKFQKNCSDDGKTLNSAYGARIFGIHNEDEFVEFYKKIEFDQWKNCVNKLKEDKDSRQAIIHLHTPNDKKTKDEVCTLTLQFLIRNNKLNMITTMRSNDVVLGFTYDVFAFTFMQELMANELGVGLGIYCHNVGSMHIYSKEFYGMKTNLLHECSFVDLGEMKKINFDIYSQDIKDFIQYERGMRKDEGQQDTFVKNEFEAFYKYAFFLKYCRKKGYSSEVSSLKIQELRDLGFENVADILQLTTKGKNEGIKIVVEGIDGAGKDTFINEHFSKNDFDFVHFGLPSDNFDFFENYRIHILSDKNEIINRFFPSEEVYSVLRTGGSRIKRSKLSALLAQSVIKNVQFKIFVIENEKQKEEVKARMVKNGDKDLVDHIDKLNAAYKEFGKMMKTLFGLDVTFYNIWGKEIKNG